MSGYTPPRFCSRCNEPTSLCICTSGLPDSMVRWQECDPRPAQPDAPSALERELEIDCGDNSCMFATKKGGMRTNGGCRCLEHHGFSRSTVKSLHEMLPEIIRLRAENARLIELIEACKDSLEVYANRSNWYDLLPNGRREFHDGSDENLGYDAADEALLGIALATGKGDGDGES